MDATMPQHRAPRPTMGDVGRLAGVSRATVSFVVNRTPGQSIPEATRQRVLTAVATLSYRPNRAAQALRTRTSATIGFITHELPERSLADLAVSGAHDAAEARGSRLLLVTTGQSQPALVAAIDDLLDRQVDAIIVATSGTRPIEVPEAARRRPTVLVNCFEHHHTRPTVLPDERVGGYSAARLALDAGHRSFAFLAGIQERWATAQRVAGYRRALTEAGVDPRAQVLAHGNYQIDSGHDLARDLVATATLPTAILCGNDRMAVGVLLALAQAGVRVPDDVSVVGYDDQVGLAAALRPALSTVRLPYLEMGQWAAAKLLDHADHDTNPGTTAELLPCPVVPRDSVAPPRSVRDDHE